MDPDGYGNRLDNLHGTTDALGKQTWFDYDSLGNLIRRSDPTVGGPQTTFAYDPSGNGLLTSVTDQRGKTTTFGYDAQANLASTVTPMGFRTTMTYDSAGRMATIVDPRGNVTGALPADYTTTFTHDAASNVLTVTDALAHTTTNVYDPAGLRRSITDPNNHATTFEYDNANHLAAVIDAASKRTEYGYDNVGNLTTRTDPKGRITTYAYDLAMGMTGETRPLNRVWTYSYDANGNLTKVIDPIAAATPVSTDYLSSFVYDDVNRAKAATYFGYGTVTSTFDGNNNRRSMTDPSGTGVSTFTYDELDRLASYRLNTRGLDYVYDAAGNLTRRTYTDGTIVTLGYDDDGRMSSMLSAGLQTNYGYDEAANLKTTVLPAANGYVDSRIYDRAGRLTEVKNQKGATILSRATYVLDPAGNRSSMQTTTGTITYTYDLLDRLTQACYTVACAAPGDNFRRYTYDDVGNRLTEVRDTGTTTYTNDAADQLTGTTGPAGAVTYGYDADGRQTSAGSASFVWNAMDRIASTTSGSTTTTYAYDGAGTRTLASTGTQASKKTLYDWDPSGSLTQLVAERDGNAALVRRYRSGLDTVTMDTGGTPFYYHYDGLGSIVNLTSSTGVTQWTYAYLPFGGVRTETKNQSQAPVNVLRYTGELLDPTGLYHLRARQYESATGRFLGSDPVRCQVGRPYISTYTYVNGNPINSTDPSGGESVTPATWGQVTSDCVSLSGQVGIMGAVHACITSGHFQIQVGVGASTGVGATLGVTHLETDASTPSQLAGFGGSFGASGGAGIVGGGDRGYAYSGRLINTVSGTTGLGLDVSPELFMPAEIHAEGSLTVDTNDLLHTLFGF